MQAQALEKSKQNSKVEQLRREFNEKSAILEKHGKLTSPAEYYADLYGDDGDEIMPYTVSNETPAIRRAQNIDEVLQIAMFRDDIYTYSCSFFGGWPKERLVNNVYAFVIDLDGVSPADLRVLLKREIKKFLPSYIVNSGQGVHIVYMFTIPVAGYTKRKKVLKQAIKALAGLFKVKTYSYKVDPTAMLVHPYRVVGSRTKLGQTAKAYKVGEKREVVEMLKLLNIDTYLFEKHEKKQTTQRKARSYNNEVAVLPTGRVRFYDSTYERVRHEVDEGHRYLSLFALAIIAYKCRIPRAQIEEDIGDLVDLFNQKEHVKRVRENEIEKAMMGYSQKFVKVNSYTLEEYLGFTFHRSTKRNGLKQREHLLIARAVKDARQKATKEIQMKRCLEVNPKASLKELVETLGWGKATVVKYRKLVLQGV